MATTRDEYPEGRRTDGNIGILRFSIDGLLGQSLIDFTLPHDKEAADAAKILILSGINGSGKTTILKMLRDILELDFNLFRKLPFKTASVYLTDNHVLRVDGPTPDFGDLKVTMDGYSTPLGLKKSDNDKYPATIEAFRAYALPIVSRVDYTFLGVDRANAGENRRDYLDESEIEARYRRDILRGRRDERVPSLSESVVKFMADAQVDYRRFFRANELDLLPRILKSLSRAASYQHKELLDRLDKIASSSAEMARYGLQTDGENVSAIRQILDDSQYNEEQRSLSVIASYVDMQESIGEARSLIARRLIEFEDIMCDFLIGKTIKVDATEGLIITTSLGKRIGERDLSSGEYHFLYMMVSALLCQRSGSIIAIDEPELSLHVTWQRKLVGALMRCAAGASPLFILATHSISISAEHSDSRVEITPLD